MKYIQIIWTCANIEEARSIASDLVENHYVACTTIIPKVESIYLWEGKMCHDDEVKVVMKTTSKHWEKVRDIIEEKSSYDTPQILRIDITDGNKKYLKWMEETL